MNTYHMITQNFDELYHHGIKGQKWGIRRYQNPDGSLTAEGKKRYGSIENFNRLSAAESKMQKTKNVSGLKKSSGVKTGKSIVDMYLKKDNFVKSEYRKTDYGRARNEFRKTEYNGAIKNFSSLKKSSGVKMGKSIVDMYLKKDNSVKSEYRKTDYGRAKNELRKTEYKGAIKN